MATAALLAASALAPVRGEPARQRSAQTASASTAQSSLDFQIYRTRIEPVFLKQREGGVMCYACHSVLATRLRLQPFSAGRSSWTERQSRLNFEVVSQLVAPGNPLASRLLLHPLALEAGGDAMHTGGKFWKSQNDPEWQMIAEWIRAGHAAKPAAQEANPPAEARSPDFEFFKTRVEPIFLKKRPGRARCYACHAESTNLFSLAKLSPGSSSWTEEQSRRNFKNSVSLIIPGDPTASRLVLHALAPGAGGDPFHSGGWQFESRNDPDWAILVEWVRGEKAN
jgi:hypothetical protein